jgi:hypothetical protein
MDQVPVLLASASDVTRHIKPEPAAPLHFRLTDVVEPPAEGGLPLIPFFRLHNQRYQMYWRLTSREQIAAEKERLVAEERAKALREANTLDRVAPGEQQPEVEHDFLSQNSDSGLRDGNRWRRGEWFQYKLSPRGEKSVDLAVTYWGGDAGRGGYEIRVNGELLVNETLENTRANAFVEKRYPLPARFLTGSAEDRITVRFSARSGAPGRPPGVYDVRLLKTGSASNTP